MILLLLCDVDGLSACAGCPSCSFWARALSAATTDAARAPAPFRNVRRSLPVMRFSLFIPNVSWVMISFLFCDGLITDADRLHLDVFNASWPETRPAHLQMRWSSSPRDSN